MSEKNIKNIPQVMKILEQHYPYVTTTLNSLRLKNGKKPDAYKILISCLLSLRTKDKNTDIVTERLFAVIKTPEELVKLPLIKLEKLIFSSGHYKKKSRILKHVSRVLIKEHNSRVPDTREELMAIKGIGPKTANIVLAFAFNKLVLPIDVHCHRIPNRLGWIRTKSAEKSEFELEKILPKKYWREFNSIFVQFGQTLCVPISPRCSECPVFEYCSRIGVLKSR